MNETESNLFDAEATAKHLAYRPNRRLDEFRALALPQRSAVFSAFSPQMRQEVLADLSLAEAVELLDHLDPQRAQHILARLPNAARRRKIITRLKNDLYKKAEQFLQFHPRATISLLHLNYISLSEATTIGQAAEVIEQSLRETGKVPVILVSNNGVLSGEVPLTTLVRERNASKLKNHVKPIRSVDYNSDRQAAMDLLTDRPHTKVAVTDTDGSVLGIIYSDDVFDLFSDQPATSLYSFAGVAASERPFDGTFDKVRHRYRWLILNLATCFLAGGVVGAFNETLSKYVLLAVYMPIVAGMAGNASTQTLAVMVRGLSIGEITLKNCAPAVWNEVKAGFLNGAVTGALVLLIALIFGGNLGIGLVAGVSIVAAMMISGFFGAIVPIALKHFGKDPATSAGILISTATDVFGFLLLLGLATLLLF